MIFNDTIFKALQFSMLAHGLQEDKGGELYIFHPIAVCLDVHTPLQKICALLHDVVEDTSVTIDVIEKEFGSYVADVVNLLTKKQGYSYHEYINGIMTNKDAVAVKMADLRDNMSLYRLKGITQKDFDRIKKYRNTYEILSALSGKG